MEESKGEKTKIRIILNIPTIYNCGNFFTINWNKMEKTANCAVTGKQFQLNVKKRVVRLLLIF
jgi:hypothetical protein